MGPMLLNAGGVERAESMDVDSDQLGEHSGGFLPDLEDVILPSPILSPADEARKVAETESEALPSEGVKQFVIAGSWWRSWCAYSGFVVVGNMAEVQEPDEERPLRPGPINNQDLVVDTPDGVSSDLRDGLEEGKDFVVRSEGTWKLLHEWYGGGPELMGDTYQPQGEGSGLTVDLYPLKLKVTRTSDWHSEWIKISKTSNVALLRAKALKALGLEDSEVQMWDYFNSTPHGLLDTHTDRSLESARIMADQEILLQQKVNGVFPGSPCKRASQMTFAPQRPLALGYHNSLDDTVAERPGATKGLAGLQNLGNTCFMNSSLQCLAHTVPLMQVFLSGNFKSQINRDNPLGRKGELAEAFGTLMEKLWQGGIASVAPRGFKMKLGRFASQFQGYQQQDSQELLSFLLDGLHEDCNRIKKKPYIPEDETEGRSDEELAAETWSNYRARNDSFVVDHCQGMYKSQLDCPDCNNSSVKFEAFMYLSLPLPSSRTRTIIVTVVTVDGSRMPTIYAVDVPKGGTVKDLYFAVAARLGLSDGLKPEEVLLMVEVLQNKVHVRLNNLQTSLMAVHDHLVAYLYPSPDVGPMAGQQEVQVFHRRFGRKQQWCPPEHHLFAAPLVFFMEADKVQFVAKSAAETPPNATFSQKREYLLTIDNEINSIVETALRPFKRIKRTKPANDENAPPANGAEGPVPGNDSDADATTTGMVMVDVSDVAERPEWDGPDEAAAPVEPGTPTGVSLVGEHSTTSTPRVTPRVSPETTPHGSPTAFPASEPFNMWPTSIQEGRGSPDGAVSAEADDNGAWDGEPYVLKQADQWGVTALWGQPSVSSSAPAYFAIDWANRPAWEDVYDYDQLDHPKIDESARIAKEKEEDGPVKHTLQQCFDAYLQPEKLEEDDKWYCNKCKQHVQADKKLDFWQAPEVLVVHLKRFSFSRSMRDKLTAEVDFPLRGLDLSPYIIKEQEVPPIYDLYAVSNHYGGLGGGHYTAFCKMPGTENWYCFDDALVNTISKDEVCSANAYLLFYRRRDAAGREAEEVEKLLSSTRAVTTEEAAGDSDADMEDQARDDAMPMSATATPRSKDAGSGDEEMISGSAQNSPAAGVACQHMPAVELHPLGGQEGESSSDAGSDGVMVPGLGMDTSGVFLQHPGPVVALPDGTSSPSRPTSAFAFAAPFPSEQPALPSNCVPDAPPDFDVDGILAECQPPWLEVSRSGSALEPDYKEINTAGDSTGSDMSSAAELSSLAEEIGP